MHPPDKTEFTLMGDDGFFLATAASAVAKIALAKRLPACPS